MFYLIVPLLSSYNHRLSVTIYSACVLDAPGLRCRYVGVFTAFVALVHSFYCFRDGLPTVDRLWTDCGPVRLFRYVVDGSAVAIPRRQLIQNKTGGNERRSVTSYT